MFTEGNIRELNNTHPAMYLLLQSFQSLCYTIFGCLKVHKHTPNEDSIWLWCSSKKTVLLKRMSKSLQLKAQHSDKNSFTKQETNLHNELSLLQLLETTHFNEVRNIILIVYNAYSGIISQQNKILLKHNKCINNSMRTGNASTTTSLSARP